MQLPKTLKTIVLYTLCGMQIVSQYRYYLKKDCMSYKGFSKSTKYCVCEFITV